MPDIANDLVKAYNDGYKQGAADMEAKLRDAVNELCLRCGEYRQQHLGACDGCKFKDMK